MLSSAVALEMGRPGGLREGGEIAALLHTSLLMLSTASPLRKASSLKFSDRTLRLRKGILPKTADFGDKESGFKLPRSFRLPLLSLSSHLLYGLVTKTQLWPDLRLGCWNMLTQDASEGDFLLLMTTCENIQGHRREAMVSRDWREETHSSRGMAVVLARPLSYFPGEHALGMYSGGREEGTGRAPAQEPRLPLYLHSSPMKEQWMHISQRKSLKLKLPYHTARMLLL